MSILALKINQYNPAYQQIKEERTCDHINQSRKSIWQNPMPLPEKNKKKQKQLFSKLEIEGNILDLDIGHLKMFCRS